MVNSARLHTDDALPAKVDDDGESANAWIAVGIRSKWKVMDFMLDGLMDCLMD